MANLVDQAKGQMEKSIESTKENFAGIRTGRANPALLNGITVEYYGAPTPLKSVATIGVPEPRTLSVTPFDPSQANAVERRCVTPTWAQARAAMARRSCSPCPN